MAQSITDHDCRDRALAALPKALAAAGDFDGAEAIAGSIIQPNRRAWALAELAKVLTAAGDTNRAQARFTEAEALARLITDPNRQAEALTWLAKLSVTESTADRLIAAAFRLATWSLPLSALVTRHSSVLVALADEVVIAGGVSSA
jgi:hypothetical protein